MTISSCLTNPYVATIKEPPKSSIKSFIVSFNASCPFKGISFLEIYQNCVIFNDKAHDVYTNRQTRDENTLYVEDGKKMIFGKEKNKGIKLNGFNLEVVTIGENGVGEDDLS